MGEYLSPGVYVEEVSSGAKPIAGVGTSTGAFVGIAEKGQIGKAKLITNWTQFVNTFGVFIPDGYLAYAVYQFFNEGGTKCYVVRTCHYTDSSDPTTKESKASAATLMDDEATPAKSLRVTASSDGKWGDKLTVDVKAATDIPDGFKMIVKYKNAKDEDVEVELFDNLTISDVEDTINKKSAYIRVEKDAWKENGGSETGSGKIPKKDQVKTLTGGNDGILKGDGSSSLEFDDFVGDEGARNGLHAFDTVDDINIVAIPDMAGDISTIKGAYTYCDNRKDCFFVADSPKDKTPTEILNIKKTNFKTSYGALYYPWIEVADPLGGNKLLPPSGAIAGIYSRTDVTRGVHKAPAGITEGYIKSAIGLERILTKGEHDTLNNPGINVIRFFPGSGICVWGTRTMSDDPEWKYLNVRRLFLFLEESIDEGTQWVVFEPNDPSLWGSIKRNLTAFLLRVWRDGALFGLTPDEAFFVKVDAENNPPEVRDAGQLIIEVGVAPVKPAEFVIIRISQKTLTK
ncbi:MAG: phage tail sheath subtilisin-like domain-containing protein [Nitrospinota bacterium]